MKMPAAAILILAGLALAGCETTGGTIGGLFPAPRFLKGDIKDGIYTAQNKSFSVEVPHKKGEEWLHMQVKEQADEYGSYVSFGPAAMDRSIYRVTVARRVAPGSEQVKFDEAAPKMIDEFKTQLRNGYRAELNQLVLREESVKGRKSYYYKFTQVVPAGVLVSNKPTQLTHDVYVIDFGKGAALVWVEKSELTWVKTMEPRALAESVVVH